MKKVILTFGVISGVLSSVLMLATVPFLRDLEHGQKGLIIGYTAIVLSFLLVYFGIRSFRDNVAGGTITFGKAFTIGISITLISCLFYVVTWEILYFNFLHGFMDSYFARLAATARASSSDPQVVQAKLAAVARSQAMYEKPLINALYTFIEPFPVGLLITLISSVILRRSAAAIEPAGAQVAA